ncbi:hypothetical protein L596_029547 [Steinernema carpocapsae]|uniref:UPAR/Ly6 domain-containing protein n=1 Tax=Steinernema carpocapsae TaxID=34508 RepID=A0A4U5LUZ3_STECR|nr:hypothetical protein L596_029547 [Steinernema carpocapsae]
MKFVFFVFMAFLCVAWALKCYAGGKGWMKGSDYNLSGEQECPSESEYCINVDVYQEDWKGYAYGCRDQEKCKVKIETVANILYFVVQRDGHIAKKDLDKGLLRAACCSTDYCNSSPAIFSLFCPIVLFLAFLLQ